MTRNSQPAQPAAETAAAQPACPYYPRPGGAPPDVCESQQIMRAIRAGEVDALVVSREGEERIFTLAGAETPYRMLVEQMQEGALTISATGTILYANNYFADLMNTPLERVMGASLLSFTPDPGALLEFVGELQRGPARCELELLRSGNGVIPAFISGSRLPGQEGDRFCLVVTDLTEQKWVEELRAAETAWRDSNGRLELLTDVVGELLRSPEPQNVVYNLARKVMKFLDCQVFFNYLLEPHTGRLHLNACEGIPADVARRIEWLDRGVAVCGCVARDGERIVAECIADNPSPRTELVASFGVRAYACHPLQAGGRIIGTLSFGTRTRDHFRPDDLALMRAVADHIAIAMERIQHQQDLCTAKERLESTLSSITDAYFALDDEWRFLEINLVAEHTIFKRPAAELLGKHYLDEYPVTRESDCARQLGLAIQSRVPVHFEARSLIAERWFEAHAYPYKGRLEVYARDITERKEWEFEREALLDSERAARGEAERANHLKDEFLANLSHELRTPLTAVLGWVQLLQRGKLKPEEQREAINIIDRNSRLQAQLISDLLDMSRVLSGKLRLEMQRVHLVPVAEAALASILPLAEEKGVRLDRTLDAVGPVRGDPTRLQQTIWNLLSNAVKFTPPAGRVHLSVGEHNGHVEVAVSDTGIGIKPEFLPHVFERFRQADGSTTRRQGGLGLGLSIVKQLTDMHGGEVRVFSDGENCGTTFTVRLPRLRAPEERDGLGGANGARPLRQDIQQLVGRRVLVVDDDPIARDLLSRLLLECKAEVMAASSGPEALQMIGAVTPHLVLSDIGMPGQDGYQFLRELRKRPAERGGTIPVIAVTAYARPEDRLRSMAAGFQGHICKPIDPSELLDTIGGLLETTPAQARGEQACPGTQT